MMRKNLVRMIAMAMLLVLLMTLLPLSALAAEEKGTVTCTSLNLRQSASTDSKSLQTLSKGDTVIIKGATGDWYKVNYGKYTGYVMKKYIKKGTSSSSAASSGSSKSSNSTAKATTTTTKSKAEQIKDLGAAPATSKPGDSGAKVTKLQKALKIMGYFSGTVDGKYNDATTAAVKKYQKSVSIYADGVAGSKTIAKLFNTQTSAVTDTTDPGKGKETESLDWFKKGSNTLPKRQVFTVKDCKSGKTFKVKRWSGSNHADVEPLTAGDTRTMLSIYGHWSWKRRAVLVYYNGHVYAGSMNGMPHGTGTINDNDFDGHFCIHFTGSKTHGSKQVDSEHQNQVNNAMKYRW